MHGTAICSRSPEHLGMRVFLLALAAALMAPRKSCFVASRNVGPQWHVEDIAGRVSVYVYEHPVFDETAVIQCYRNENEGVAPWQDEREGMAQDAGEIWLHQSLLSHPWRVLDPEIADVFFIPIYPVLNAKVQLLRKKCDGLDKWQRATNAIMHLVKNSPYFNRFGGADHVVVCSWWNCGKSAFDPQHRMLLRRTVLGINEKLDDWSMWGCRSRMVTVPYTPSSAVTAASIIGGRSAEERNIPFFFEGTARARPERENMQVVKQLSPESRIDVGKNMHIWNDKPSSYAEHISRSRFCFCPRGDTISSRRIYDAIAAGCIPIITTEEFEALPFMGTGLNYTQFVVVAGNGSFSTTEGVAAIVKDLTSRSDEQLILPREALSRGRSSTVYGMTTGPTLADMEPFHGTASRFLQQVQILLENGGLWNCPSSHLSVTQLSQRTRAKFPPKGNARSRFLHQSETIVDVDHSLLFCAPPNTGSLQFRMLAKRMKGVDHWSVSNIQSLLFDSVQSKLPLLNLTDKRLMEEIYKDNSSGWIKIGVVRDPVTRLLSAYLDLVRTWPSRRAKSSSHNYSPHHPHRGLRIDHDWEWFDAIARHRSLTKTEFKQQQPEIKGHRNQRTWERGYEGEEVAKEGGDGSRLLEDAAVPTLPTFEELLDMLEHRPQEAPSAFRPAASLCGMGLSPFDTIIPFESLQQTSTKVLKSLPGDIWRDFGEWGWGPQGKNAFMEFDYGTVARHYSSTDQGTADALSPVAVKREHTEEKKGQPRSMPIISPHAGDLFSGDSCAWTEYYTDQTLLDTVGRIYSEDFDLFAWYDLQQWRERLGGCLDGA